MSGKKTGSLGQILEKPCVHSRGHIFSPIVMKLGQTFCLAEILYIVKMGHVGLKTKSLDQILAKPYVRSRGHIFSLVMIKLNQNFCLDELSNKGENWSCRVKSKVTRSNLRKTLCTFLGPHFQWSEYFP